MVSNNLAMWSGLLVETESCKLGLVWLFVLFLLLLSLLLKGLELCCLFKGHFIRFLDDEWLSKFSLHLPHVDL